MRKLGREAIATAYSLKEIVYRRVFYYGCSAHQKAGRGGICKNGAVMRKTCIDDAVLREIGGHMLRPAAIDAIVEGVLQALAPEATATAFNRTRAELAAVERDPATCRSRSSRRRHGAHCGRTEGTPNAPK